MSAPAGRSARRPSPLRAWSPCWSSTCGRLARQMPRLRGIGTEYYLFGGAGVISLLAFAALILSPAIGSYGRTWEKATAALLPLFVLAALLLLGGSLGVLIGYCWDDITRIIPGLN